MIIEIYIMHSLYKLELFMKQIMDIYLSIHNIEICQDFKMLEIDNVR